MNDVAMATTRPKPNTHTNIMAKVRHVNTLYLLDVYTEPKKNQQATEDQCSDVIFGYISVLPDGIFQT